jgi:hypothetical protein
MLFRIDRGHGGILYTSFAKLEPARVLTAKQREFLGCGKPATIDRKSDGAPLRRPRTVARVSGIKVRV